MTNKRKSIITIAVAFCLVFVVLCASIALATGNDIVVDGEIRENYSRGTKLQIPSAKLTVGATDYKASHKVIYPDGRTTTDPRATLDTIGVYKLVYSATDGTSNYQKDFEFLVEDSFSSLFSYGDNVKNVIETSIPSYMGEKYSGTRDGIKFTVTENDTTINYNGVIDLTKVGFSVEQMYWYQGHEWDHNNDGIRDRVHPQGVARENEFLELLITPEDNATKEFNALEIKLTDIHDPNNFLRYDITAGDMKFSQPHQSFLGVTASDKFESSGYDNLKMGSTGANMELSFYGQNGSSWSDSLKLYFDNQTLECVGYPRTADHQTSVTFDKFQDSTVVGLGNEWFGFTTGEVYLEITVKNMLAKECSFMILGVGGHKTATSPEDEIVISPITGDLDGDGDLYDADNLPYAVAGVKNTYPVFDAVAYHTMGGLLNVQSKVYYGNNRENVAIKDGKFKTDKEGTYYIEYEVSSPYGSKILELPITALSAYQAGDVPDFVLLPETTSVTESGIGDIVTVYDGVEINGIGIWSKDIKLAYRATATDAWTQKDIIGTQVRYFLTDLPGEYRLTYTASDSLGTEFVREHVVNVSYDAIPRLSAVNVPTTVIKGRSITFPIAQAQFISPEGEKAVNVQVFIGGVDYTNRAYVAESNFTVVYRASLAEDTTKYVEQSYTVKVVDLTEGIPSGGTGEAFIATQANAFLNKYFEISDLNSDSTPDFTTSVDKNNLIFTTSTDNASFTFINKIPMELFNVVLNVSATLEENRFDAIDIYLTDSVNPQEELKLSIVKIIKEDLNSNLLVYTQFFLNDEMMGKISGSFNGTSTSPFTISYNKLRKTFYDSMDEALCTPTVYTNGMEYTGFSSGYVYMRVALSGVTGETSVKLSEICSQPFNSKVNKDNVAPQLMYSKNMSTSIYTNVNVPQVISAAIGYDVLSEVASVEMTLIGPNNNTIYKGAISSDYPFTPDQIGKYTIRYTATDTAGKRLPNKSFFIFVQEENAPTVTVKTSPNNVYYVGDELTISGATVTDDTDPECILTIYVETPTLSLINVKEGDKYTFSKAGVYIVNYYARDKYYNKTVVSYTIQVVEKEG